MAAIAQFIPDRVTNCLVLLNFVLLVVVAIELQGRIGFAPTVSAAPPPRVEVTPEPQLIAFRPPSRDQFVEILERPLFEPSRRPYVPPEGEPQPREGERIAIKVLGTALTDVQRLALVRLGTQAKAIWIREGQLVSSWRVERIRGDRLILQRNGETRTITLWRTCPGGAGTCSGTGADRTEHTSSSR